LALHVKGIFTQKGHFLFVTDSSVSAIACYLVREKHCQSNALCAPLHEETSSYFELKETAKEFSAVRFRPFALSI
jgi:hypothetical protein